jgi:hypothetical protein
LKSCGDIRRFKSLSGVNDTGEKLIVSWGCFINKNLKKKVSHGNKEGHHPAT